MSKCEGLCLTGKKCRKIARDNGYCYIHDINLNCLGCNKLKSVGRRIILDCGHNYCLDCVKLFTWFDGISTDDPINCPECNEPVNDTAWEKISQEYCSIFFENKRYVRNIIYNFYLCPEEYSRFKGNVNTEISSRDLIRNFNVYDNKLLKVDRVKYELDVPYCFPLRNFYKIQYPVDEARKYFMNFIFKELMEYCYHPSRVNFEL
jgi:hypothetical protein